MPKRKKLVAAVDENEIVSGDTLHERPLPVDSMPEMTGVVRDVARGDQTQTINELRAQLDEAKTNPEMEKERVIEAILAGRLSLEFHPAWLIDQVGTDRDDPLGNKPGDESSFEDLAADIERNGQMQPVRVRVSADTQEVRDALYSLVNRMRSGDPEPLPKTAPGELHGRLFLQSGRRRSKACELKDRPVLAFVSADTNSDTPVEAADLLERFRENALRSDLSGWEKIRSIAQIKNALPKVSQQSLAEKLGIGRGDISVAVDAVSLEDALEEMFGPGFRDRGIRWFRESVPAVKRRIAEGGSNKKDPDTDEPKPKPTPIQATREAGRVALSNGLRVSAGRGGSIKIDLEDGSKPSPDQIEFILEAIAKGAGKVK